MSWRSLAILEALAALTVAPAAQAATQRYAAPTGSGTACTSTTPCDITQAINSAAAGDEVILTGQDYGSVSTPLTNPGLVASVANLDVHGEDGQPRPRIFTNALNGVDLEGAGVTARHFEVDQVANGTNQHALVFDGAVASDLVARNIGGNQGKACTLLANSTLTSSVCEATGTSGNAIFPYRINGTPGAPKANHSIIRNVTAVASGTSGLGILALGGSDPADVQDLTVTNTIIIVPTGGVAIQATDQTADAFIRIDHSNFGFQSSTTFNHIVRGAGNQQLVGSPTFVAPGDYHQAPGSMTIDKGVTDPLNGPTDFDGDGRSLGLGGTDIGADEFVPPPVVVTGAPGATTATTAVVNGTVNPSAVATTYHFDYGTTTDYGASTPETGAGSGTAVVPVAETLSGLKAATTYHYRLVATSAGGTTPGADTTVTTAASPGSGQGGSSDKVAPKFLGSIALTKRTFAAAGSGVSARPAAKRRKAPVGTVVTFKLDEAASVDFTVERARPGRRAGRKCVKPTKRNRKAKRCTRFLLRSGSFTVAGKAGQTRFRFSGRLGNKKLPAGSYRLVAVATDPSGNRSAAKRAAFRIVRR